MTRFHRILREALDAAPQWSGRFPPTTATENATMEANMPPPVHDFWVGAGRAMFQGFVAELRG